MCITKNERIAARVHGIRQLGLIFPEKRYYGCKRKEATKWNMVLHRMCEPSTRLRSL